MRIEGGREMNPEKIRAAQIFASESQDLISLMASHLLAGQLRRRNLSRWTVMRQPCEKED